VSLILINHNGSRNNNNFAQLQFYIGLVVFVIGLYINIQSDQLLLIEKSKAIHSKNGSSKYVIPRGGMFEYVSCANYCK